MLSELLDSTDEMKLNNLDPEEILRTDAPSPIDFSAEFHVLGDRIRSMKNGK